jgi:hypothetical protein
LQQGELATPEILTSLHHSLTKYKQNWVYAVDYMSITGIMTGQTVVGFEGDWVGRKWGMIQGRFYSRICPFTA